jgi:hypothetical protein
MAPGRLIVSDEESPTPFLDQVVDEILRGERVVLVPPGTVTFVMAFMSLLIGSALLCSLALPALLGGPDSHRAIGILVGLGVALVSLLVPAFLVVHGFPMGLRSFVAVTSCWLGAACIALVASLLGTLPLAPRALAPPTVLLASASLITRTTTCGTFVLFKQRLHARRKLLLQEMSERGSSHR